MTPTNDDRDDDLVPKLGEPRFSQSLERGLAILRCFSGDRPVLGIADMADQIGLSRSTTHRYAVTLVELGYLEQEPDRKYRLGLRVTDLGMSVVGAIGLGERAASYLRNLTRQTGYSAGIAVLSDARIVYLHRAPGRSRGRHPVDFGLATGSQMPAHCTAAGKVLLAHLSEAEQKRLLDQMSLKAKTKNTLTSKKALRDQMVQIAQSGFAVDDQEYAENLLGVARPLISSDGEAIAAVDVLAGAAQTNVGDLTAIAKAQLRTVVGEISRALGNSPASRR